MGVLHDAMRKIWLTQYGEAARPVFENILRRGGIGDTGESQSMWDKTEKSALAVIGTDAVVEARIERAFYVGLEAAARKVDDWGHESGGGSGIGGDGYFNLADAIRKIDPKKGY